MNRTRLVMLVSQMVLLTLGCNPEDATSPEDTSAQDSALEDLEEQDVDVAEPDTASPDTAEPDVADGDASADGDVEEDTVTLPPGVVEYPQEEALYTTLQAVWRPLKPPSSTIDAIRQGDLLMIHDSQFEAMGLGAELAGSEPWQEHNELAPGYEETTLTEAPRSVSYFWQAADSQIIDEESPIRFEGVYLTALGSSYKPHSHLTTQAFEAMVRTARRISEASGRPFDFGLVTGDLSDGGQLNELDWFVQVMNGGAVDPDSGKDDDPVRGPGNDFNDPFYSRGLGVPWYATIGNHEVLYTGLFPPTEEIRQASMGDTVVDTVEQLLGFISGEGLSNGYRDGATPGAVVVSSGTTPADERRLIGTLEQTLTLLQEAGGLGPVTLEQAEAGVGYFSTRPVPGAPIRLIVLNTLSSLAASDQGALDRTQYAWMLDELETAEAAGELVIVANHHGAESLRSGSEVTTAEFVDTLTSFDCVILHLTGHGHHYDSVVRPSARARGLGHWELMVAGTVDFPSHSRIFEFVYEGEGYLTIYATSIENLAAPGTPAYEHRQLAVARKFFTGTSFDTVWEERKQHRNLILRFKLNDTQVAAIEAGSYPERVESLETLATFPAP